MWAWVTLLVAVLAGGVGFSPIAPELSTGAQVVFILTLGLLLAVLMLRAFRSGPAGRT